MRKATVAIRMFKVNENGNVLGEVFITGKDNDEVLRRAKQCADELDFGKGEVKTPKVGFGKG